MGRYSLVTGNNPDADTVARTRIDAVDGGDHFEKAAKGDHDTDVCRVERRQRPGPSRPRVSMPAAAGEQRRSLRKAVAEPDVARIVTSAACRGPELILRMIGASPPAVSRRSGEEGIDVATIGTAPSLVGTSPACSPARLALPRWAAAGRRRHSRG